MLLLNNFERVSFFVTIYSDVFVYIFLRGRRSSNCSLNQVQVIPSSVIILGKYIQGGTGTLRNMQLENSHLPYHKENVLACLVQMVQAKLRSLIWSAPRFRCQTMSNLRSHISL